ncbi:hypothetical protein AHiyo6_21270 [Arthrobacter sp. Hiyo6]|nr:hypothetical protein AHiyo6_21270 [Arthrobacter sp. Hiyo6]
MAQQDVATADPAALGEPRGGVDDGGVPVVGKSKFSEPGHHLGTPSACTNTNNHLRFWIIQRMAHRAQDVGAVHGGPRLARVIVEDAHDVELAAVAHRARTSRARPLAAIRIRSATAPLPAGDPNGTDYP